MADVASTRRQVLAGTLAGVGSLMAPPASAAQRIPIGAACNHYVLSTDPEYRAALARNVDVIVAEGAMKWDALRPSREAFEFAHADATARFARSAGLALRGHTLVWCVPAPQWLQSISSSGEAEREMRRHIERVVPRYANQIRSWDVVNEPIAEQPADARDLRQGVWQKWLGERYIDVAFRAAKEAEPGMQRVLNEYGIEAARPQDRKKREAFLRLIRDLLNRGAPVTAIGIQGHLQGDIEIDADGLSRFCEEIRRMGLDLLITELDVIDYALPGPVEERDASVAAKAERFLSAVFAGHRPSLICTWGLTDRYTWVPTYYKRTDGRPNRPLPFDSELKPKPLWSVIQRFSSAT